MGTFSDWETDVGEPLEHFLPDLPDEHERLTRERARRSASDFAAAHVYWLAFVDTCGRELRPLGEHGCCCPGV